MAKKSGSKGRRAAAPESRASKPKAPKSKGPQRDSEGPLGWLAPDLESAYTLLGRRGEPVPAPVAKAKSRSTLSSGRTALHEVNRSIWRNLLMQYKSRKVEAARTRALAPAPMVPGGRNWLPLGPTLVLNGQTVGQEPVGGRVAGLAVAPGGQVLYAASANGGVFKSDDGATSWRSMMDGFDLDPTNFGSASVVCGAIAIDPADPDRVYVGTGEGDTDLMFRQNFRVVHALPAYRGVGPLRSDDGGVKWILEDSQPDLAGESFFALAVEPGNRENVVAATTNGLYRRVPATGGKFRWEQKRAGIYSSVVVASGNGTTRFIAAEWGKGVLQSTDGGNTWSSISSGFPSTGIGRIALAVQADNPSPAYALVAKSGGGLQGLFRLEATGGWKKVSSVPNILPGSQGDYDLSISISPGDPETLYIAGDRINVFPFSAMIVRCRIQASGTAFKVKTATSIGTHAHADVHSLVHTPGDPTELWCTCDGGVYLNRNPKGTGQFVSRDPAVASTRSP